MNKERFIRLVEKLPQIERMFAPRQADIALFNGEPEGFDMGTIYQNPTYQTWRTAVEFELAGYEPVQIADNVRYEFRNIDGGWFEDMTFVRLKGYLIAIAENLLSQPVEVENGYDKYSEQGLNHYILRALTNLQARHLLWSGEENDLNDALRDSLDLLYSVNDQTRRGISQSGAGAGEIDLLIRREGLPFAIIEALRLRSLNREYLNTHINKALTNYDQVGCPHSFVVVYAQVNDFADFWNRLLEHVRNYQFPYPTEEELSECAVEQTEVRVAKLKLSRSEKLVDFRIYAIHLPNRND
jgi:hypothetical protein